MIIRCSLGHLVHFRWLTRPHHLWFCSYSTLILCSVSCKMVLMNYFIDDHVNQLYGSLVMYDATTFSSIYMCPLGLFLLALSHVIERQIRDVGSYFDLVQPKCVNKYIRFNCLNVAIVLHSIHLHNIVQSTISMHSMPKLGESGGMPPGNFWKLATQI